MQQNSFSNISSASSNDEHNLQYVDVQCPGCEKEAKITIYTIRVPGQPISIITSFKCDACGLRDNTVEEDLVSSNSPVRVEITGKFESPEDLKRLIELKKMAEVSLVREDQNFSYTVGRSGTYVMETIFQEIIDELTAIFHLPKDDESYMSRKSRESLNLETTSHISSNSSLSVSNQDNAAHVVEMIKTLLKDGVFSISIVDDTGCSRIAPRGSKPSDFDVNDVEAYNDAQVTHKLVQKTDQQPVYGNNNQLGLGN
ncbi:hypothetical protein EDEG_01176 [Edhazardia aedis USNM 41457]|uniref:Zinc finger ZPR1-type domain-containing protein n=1 Tax=Edhazardia aedis (strain USNM 41457) TaxID=1003232 RepID=J9DAW0_EDHAE|nr:hypothetical protein EDEG_01176 [Edhazardia aedis USNM 41457]|eukprot:EJW04624.1 hypothetical protein EDEG_01176 [Edhazardia aedis USNM 41457]